MNDYLHEISKEYDILESKNDLGNIPPLPPIPPPCRQVASYPFIGDIETNKSKDDSKLFINLKERRVLLNKRLGY